MADNYLITGYWGEPHVTAENDRGINAAMFGAGRFVLPVGEQFRAEYIGNNTVRMYDGKLMDNGAAAGIPAGEYVDLLIANSGQGVKRNDLIVFQYEQDASTMIETGRFLVIHGAETSGTASDPKLTQSDLLSGEATFDQMALWRVSVSGGTISEPVKLFSVYQNNVSHAADKNNPHGVTASQVGARPNNWMPTASDVGARPSNWMPSAAEVGARPSNWMPSASDVGAVNKNGDTMTDMLYVPDISVFGNGYKAVSFLSADKKGRAEVQVASSNRFVLNQRETGSAYADRYLLPALTAGLTGDKWYDILTSKTPVSIAQGGTGANNFTDALSNLGLKQFRTYYFDNCSSPLLTLQNNYNAIDNVACLIYCVCGGTRYTLVGYKVDNYCAFVEVGYGTADLYKYRNYNGTWTMHTYKAG